MIDVHFRSLDALKPEGRKLKEDIKIALINSISNKSWLHFHGGFFKKLISKNSSTITLPYLAGLTPPDVEVTIAHEPHHIENIFDEDIDMVGISVLTHSARRAYEMADKFRERGVTVVLGGIHPTAMPDEAIAHADAVVLGEAEDVWEQLIRDYQKGRMKRFYRRDNYHDLRNLPIPRWDLLAGYELFNVVIPVAASRGCPFGCEFCSTSIIYGRRYRFRPIEDVIQEIETIESKYCYFIDDNLAGNPGYAKELARRIRPLKKKWGCLIPTTAARDGELLQLFEEGGCILVDIGFESVSQESLGEMGKHHNKTGYYMDIIKRLHDHGIAIIGNFMFGFDHDDKSVFEKTLEFCIKAQIDYVAFFILMPYPGTPLYHRLKRENRLFKERWWLEDPEWANIDCSLLQVLFQPKLMSPEDLLDGFISVSKRAFELDSILERTRALKSVGLRLFCISLNLTSKLFYHDYSNFEESYQWGKFDYSSFKKAFPYGDQE